MINPWCATHCSVAISPNRRADTIANLKNAQTVVRNELQICHEPKLPGAVHCKLEMLSSWVAQDNEFCRAS